MGANAQTSVPEFTSGQVLTAQQQTEINTGIPVFADSTARDAAFGGTGEKTLAEGQFAFLEDSDTTQYYDGSTWEAVGGASGLVLISTQLLELQFQPLRFQVRLVQLMTITKLFCRAVFQVRRLTGNDDIRRYYEWLLCRLQPNNYSNGGLDGNNNNNAANWSAVGEASRRTSWKLLNCNNHLQQNVQICKLRYGSMVRSSGFGFGRWWICTASSIRQTWFNRR
jgi:hypothetical protein